MSAYRVIDKMEIVVREGVWLPFGWRALNADVLLDLVEKLRSTLPDDGARSRKGAESAESAGNAGRGTAQAAEAQASAPSGSPRNEAEIIARAQARADSIVADAQAAARDIRKGADEYADHVLVSLDTSLGKALAAVQKGRQTLATAATGNGKTPREVSTP